VSRQTLYALFLAASMWIAGCGGSGGTGMVGQPALIAAGSGTPQSTTINTAFAVPLVAEVFDGHGNPVSGVVVTFAAPATGASATFAGGVNTASTNSSGVATSAVVSANGTIGGPYTVTATVSGVSAPAKFSLTNSARIPAAITATSGTPQSAAANTAFALPLVAQVLDSSGNPVSGVVVTFAAPATGASATFAGGVNTATTTASGVATSPIVSANGTVGGPYTVTATVAGVAAPANFALTNTLPAATTENFMFYVSGPEANGKNYFIAGVFTVTPGTGAITRGEQDYNDGDKVTSPQPEGDTITGGSLTVDANTGNAKLILTTNNKAVGQGAQETFTVQFLNANHALITQQDGTTTSRGGLDLQTLPTTQAAPTGAFAFFESGVDASLDEMASGGIFTLASNGDGTSALSGIIDTNEAGSRVTGTPFTATLSAPDSLGRGTITNNTAMGLGLALNYYIIGPEVIRFINVDAQNGNAGAGSAYGQGTGTFSNASLEGSSTLSIASNSGASIFYTAAGSFSTSNTSSDPADFTGVGQINENGVVWGGPAGSPISGTYTIGSNGYGNLSIARKNGAANQGLVDLSFLGVYMVDPRLNINDPNTTSSDTGGALLVNLDDVGGAVGTGMLVPERDTPTDNLASNHNLGVQAPFAKDPLGQVAPALSSH